MNQDANPNPEPSTNNPEPVRRFVRLGETSIAATPDREAGDPLYPEAYYEFLEEAFGPEEAALGSLASSPTP